MLNVPHVHQIGATHCGVACLEMVYRYFGISNVSQEDIWEQRKTIKPNSTGEYYMRTQSMVDDLLDRGFNVLFGQISLNNKLCGGSIKRLISEGLPIIACKQWPASPILGH